MIIKTHVEMDNMRQRAMLRKARTQRLKAATAGAT